MVDIFISRFSVLHTGRRFLRVVADVVCKKAEKVSEAHMFPAALAVVPNDCVAKNIDQQLAVLRSFNQYGAMPKTFANGQCFRVVFFGGLHDCIVHYLRYISPAVAEDCCQHSGSVPGRFVRYIEFSQNAFCIHLMISGESLGDDRSRDARQGIEIAIIQYPNFARFFI